MGKGLKCRTFPSLSFSDWRKKKAGLGYALERTHELI
jgi:hypothetical protein